MSVVLSRIDNRLLHGIIVTQWAPISGATRVMVIDDKVANDDLAKASMRLAKPAGMAVSIITEETALTNFKAGKYDNQKVVIIVKSPDIILRFLENGIKIPRLVVGGTVVKEDAIKLSNRAYATEEEVKDYKQILDMGVTVVAQFVPQEKEVPIQSII